MFGVSSLQAELLIISCIFQLVLLRKARISDLVLFQRNTGYVCLNKSATDLVPYVACDCKWTVFP